MEASERGPGLPGDDYELLVPLGEGATSQVWKGRQKSLDRPVVVKLLSSGERDPGILGSRFAAEARLLASLRHPRLVEVLDFGSSDEAAWIVFPWLPGRTLEERLRSGRPLPPAAVVELLEAALDGLEFLHGRGVVHRDLKPANLFEVEERGWILLDFGLARPLTGGEVRTATGALIGTPCYMAPGQVLAQPPDPRDDLYSLGAVAYEALAGSNPFLQANLLETCNRQLQHTPRRLDLDHPGVPLCLSILVAHMLEKDRAERPASAAAARAMLAPGPVSAAPAGPATRPLAPRSPGSVSGALFPPESGSGYPARRPDPDPGPPLRPAQSSLVRAAGAAAAVAVGLALAAVFPVPRPGPAGPARPPAPPPLPPSPDQPDAEAAERVETELGAFAARQQKGQGPDPALLLDGKWLPPGAARVQRWIGAGGQPDPLPRVVRESLLRSDAGYRDLGYPGPFRLFLDGPAGTGQRPLPARVAARLESAGIPLPGALDGWAQDALAGLDAALKGRDELDGPGADERFRQGFSAPLAGVFVETLALDAAEVLRWATIAADRRIELASGLRAGTDGLERFFHGWARAVRDDPGAGELLAAAGLFSLLHAQAIAYGGLPASRPDALFAGPVDQPDQALARAAMLSLSAVPRRVWGRGLADLDRELAAALAAARPAGEAPGRAPVRHAAALHLALRTALAREDRDAIRTELARLREELPAFPPGVAAFVLHLAAVQIAEIDTGPVGPDDTRFVLTELNDRGPLVPPRERARLQVATGVLARRLKGEVKASALHSPDP